MLIFVICFTFVFSFKIHPWLSIWCPSTVMALIALWKNASKYSYYYWARTPWSHCMILNLKSLAQTFSLKGSWDVQVYDLIFELKIIILTLPDGVMFAMDIFEHVQEVDCYPNIFIAYHILFTISVTGLQSWNYWITIWGKQWFRAVKWFGNIMHRDEIIGWYWHWSHHSWLYIEDC